jgi:site-specific DNA-methyltransferase (adenine-specific)
VRGRCDVSTLLQLGRVVLDAIEEGPPIVATVVPLESRRRRAPRTTAPTGPASPAAVIQLPVAASAAPEALAVIRGEQRFALLVGDNGDLLPRIPDCSIDSVVTDPPCGINVMGLDWDSDMGGRNNWVAWLAGVFRHVYRALKPGGWALVWAIPRTSHWTAWALEDAGFEVRDKIVHLFNTGIARTSRKTPTTLRPGGEDWVLARRPLDGTIETNLARWGTGPISSVREDGSRVTNAVFTHDPDCEPEGACTETCSMRLADEQAGNAEVLARFPRFYFARKPGKKEKEAGLDALPEREKANYGAGEIGTAKNHHPTVKPKSLMQWMCRLITPPGGVVLDPFTGSGSTGVGAIAEGMRFIGIERQQDYAEVALARMRHEEAPR